jgi:hypothetical protein
MRAVFEDFEALVGPDVATFEQIRDELLAWPAYGQTLALRDALIEASQRFGVTVHPRFQPLEYPLLFAGQNEELTVVSMPLGDQGTGAAETAS